MARFFGRHIPGKPDVLAVNKPGAGTGRTSNIVVSGKVSKTRKKNRQIFIMHKGKELKTKVSGSRTKVYVDGR